ncbi:hypothetical protein BKA70DRAFT_1239665 [Coprinopsis sp. MPI-PUGE-AT-0042]|nr:hypothetical protein BKA70DRAFT_1239665 [Coprinopsis sp. MPI-PUGE-AT-0042]
MSRGAGSSAFAVESDKAAHRGLCVPKTREAARLYDSPHVSVDSSIPLAESIGHGNPTGISAVRTPTAERIPALSDEVHRSLQATVSEWEDWGTPMWDCIGHDVMEIFAITEVDYVHHPALDVGRYSLEKMRQPAVWFRSTIHPWDEAPTAPDHCLECLFRFFGVEAQLPSAITLTSWPATGFSVSACPMVNLACRPLILKAKDRCRGFDLDSTERPARRSWFSIPQIDKGNVMDENKLRRCRSACRRHPKEARTKPYSLQHDVRCEALEALGWVNPIALRKIAAR